MSRTVFLASASLVCASGVGAQPRNINTQKSTLTIHIGKTGALSGFGHDHVASVPIHNGTADMRDYAGEAVVKQTDFGIKLPGKAGIRAKGEVKTDFDAQLA